MSEYTQGVCQDGAAILKDGQPLSIEEILADLRGRDDLRRQLDAVRLEAKAHAQEARTQRSTVHEIYQLVSGSSGESGDWHGAQPVRELIAERDGLQRQLDEADRKERAIVRQYGEWSDDLAFAAEVWMAKDKPDTTSLARLIAVKQAEGMESLVPKVADGIGRSLSLSEDDIITLEEWIGDLAEVRREAGEAGK